MNERMQLLIGKIVTGCIDENDPAVRALLGRNGGGLPRMGERGTAERMGEFQEEFGGRTPPVTMPGSLAGTSAACYAGADESVKAMVADGKMIFGTGFHPKDPRIWMIGFEKASSNRTVGRKWSMNDAKKELKSQFANSGGVKFFRVTEESPFVGTLVKKDEYDQIWLFRAGGRTKENMDEKDAVLAKMPDGTYLLFAMPKKPKIRKKYPSLQSLNPASCFPGGIVQKSGGKVGD